MSINGSISNLILETWKNNNLKAATTTVVSSYRNQNVPKLRILHWPSQMASTSIQEPSRTTWNAMERLSTRKNASFYWDHFSAWRIGRTDWSAWVDVVWQLLCAIWRQILECSWLLLASSAEQRHRTAILILYLWDSWHCKLRANIFTHTHTHCIFLYTVNFFVEIEALARSVSVQRVLKTGLASLCIRSMTRRPRRHVKNATKPHSTAFCIASMTNFERMLRPSMDEMAELDEMDARAGRKRPRCAGMRATKRFWCKEKQLQLHDPKANMEGVAAIREPRKIRMERHCLPGGHFARALASVDESHENLQNTYSDIWYTIQYIIIYC